MPKITNLAAIMRSQVSALAKELPKSAGTTKRNETDENSEPFDLAVLIASKVQAIPKNHPNRREKAFRIFLETTIAAELGMDIMSDPRFLAMIEDIQVQMDTDQALQPIIENCIEQLLNTP